MYVGFFFCKQRDRLTNDFNCAPTSLMAGTKVNDSYQDKLGKNTKKITEQNQLNRNSQAQN